MSTTVIDMRSYQRIRREDPEQHYVRETVSRELARCRFSLIQITNACAEAKRLLRIGWPKEQAASEAIRRALNPDHLPPAA